MRARRSVWILLLSSACAGVSLRPETADASRLPARELSAEQRARATDAAERAQRAVMLRRFDEARAAAAEALDLDPRHARARAVLGMVHLQRALLSEPSDVFDANRGEFELELARQLAPDDPFVGWMHAVFLAESGHLSAAAAAAEAALTRCSAAPPHERSALLGIAGTYRYELGEETAAEPHLRAYVALRPDDAAAQFRLGASLLRLASAPRGPEPEATARRQAREAAAAFARCFELAPGDEDAGVAVAAAHWRAAELAHAMGDAAGRSAELDHVAERLRALGERFPDSPEPWFRAALLAEARDDRTAARAAYGEALRRAPRHVPTLLNLAAMLDAEGDAAAATTLVRELLALDEGAPVLTPDERDRLRARAAAPDQAPRIE